MKMSARVPPSTEPYFSKSQPLMSAYIQVAIHHYIIKHTTLGQVFKSWASRGEITGSYCHHFHSAPVSSLDLGLRQNMLSSDPELT